MSGRLLALDLGGTHLRAALAPAAEPTALAPLGRWPAPAGIGAFRQQVAALVAEAGAAPAAIGVTIPGLVLGTVCRWVPNLPWLDGAELAELLADFGPAVAGNDAQLALLAEAEAGAAAELSDALLLAVGTGIGSAVLAGGRVLRGSGGGACSFGWAAAALDDPGDDRHGWLERNAAGPALDAAARAIGLADGSALIAAARAGDAVAGQAAARIGSAIGTALAGAVGLLDPECILLAGGVSAAIDVLGPSLQAALRRQLPPHLRGIALRPARFGPEAGLVGAAIAAGKGAEWWKIR